MHLNLSDLFLKMQEQLDHPEAVSESLLANEQILIELVNRIRPKKPNDAEEVKQRIHALILKLNPRPYFQPPSSFSFPCCLSWPYYS